MGVLSIIADTVSPKNAEIILGGA